MPWTGTQWKVLRDVLLGEGFGIPGSGVRDFFLAMPNMIGKGF